MPERGPMSQTELHNYVIDLRGQLYVMELMVGRLYMYISQNYDHPQEFLHDCMHTILQDVQNFRLTPPYSDEAAANMREIMADRARDLFTSMHPQSG